MTINFVPSKSDQTHLTVNCYTVVTYNYNKDNPTFYVTFNYGRTILWAAVLTPIAPVQSLASTVTLGPITLYIGLKVNLQNLGNSYNVLLTGTIGDINGNTYFNSSNIGSFQIAAFEEVKYNEAVPA
ncbi:hypothetical protein [Pseudomonas sp. S1Bt23]|jgi:hypothetical protein|uniref:hypothetical protein n=1 Tax=Pseudomonas sp. S1Bt23 TaxID=3095074 RepID=UPI002A5A8E5C|nr:hypothetical protein [Pseudomonas sp. S1Bt23]WPO49537.1 hypothetical protein SHB59_10900 [Pseudomonas sp. S1Bt23]